MSISDGEESLSRFYLDLLIVHPSIDPRDITAALGLEPSHFRHVGARRATPKGNLLEGTYPDSRWRHSVYHEIRSRLFASKVDELVERLLPRRDFLQELWESGGQATLIVYFVDGYFADRVSHATLSKMVNLHIDWGTECLMESQSMGPS